MHWSCSQGSLVPALGISGLEWGGSSRCLAGINGGAGWGLRWGNRSWLGALSWNLPHFTNMGIEGSELKNFGLGYLTSISRNQDVHPGGLCPLASLLGWPSTMSRTLWQILDVTLHYTVLFGELISLQLKLFFLNPDLCSVAWAVYFKWWEARSSGSQLTKYLLIPHKLIPQALILEPQKILKTENFINCQICRVPCFTLFPSYSWLSRLCSLFHTTFAWGCYRPCSLQGFEFQVFPFRQTFFFPHSARMHAHTHIIFSSFFAALLLYPHLGVNQNPVKYSSAFLEK